MTVRERHVTTLGRNPRYDRQVLFCLTANHRTTEFDVLDRISRVTSPTAADVIAQADFVRGAIVLSTCNRFEAYVDLEDPLTAGPSSRSKPSSRRSKLPLAMTPGHCGRAPWR